MTHVPHPLSDDSALLQRWLDGELSGGERARFEAHLATCPSCAHEAAAWRELFSGLEQLPLRPAPAPALLTSRILAAVEAERPRRLHRRPRWLEAAGTAYVAGAAALLVAVGLSPWRPDLVESLRGFFSTLVTASLSSLISAADQGVELLTGAVRIREAAAQALLPLAPLWRSAEVLAAQPELRLGLALALVLTTGLLWMVHRPERGTGRIRDASAFL